MAIGGTSDARRMALSEARLHELLDLALGRMRVPEGCAAVLEGSIAEGFGNVSSDVDFLLLDDSEETYAGTPTVLFEDGRRVELRIRSTREVAADRDALWRLRAAGERAAGRIPDDLLNRCQRLARALPLRGKGLVAAVQATLPLEELGEVAARAFAWRARQRGRLAVALLVLGDVEGAAAWAETALAYGAKAWAALRGETYVELKWLSEQLRRLAARGGSDAEMAERCRALLPRPVALDGETYVPSALALLPELGVGGCPLDPARVSLARQPGVTTWPIAGRVHVLRDGRDMFVLGEKAARAWRGVVFERPLPEVVAAAGGAEAGRLVAAFHRLGLVRLAWRGGGTIAAAPAVTPAPSAARPPLGLGGATREQQVALVPLPAGRFAAAGMALVWGNVMVENAREDAGGALDEGQWGVLETVARRMLRRACLTVLSGWGMEPLPAQEEACARLAELPGLDPRLGADAVALERRIAIDGPVAAAEALGWADALVTRLRAQIGAEDFPRSFLDADRWRTTLETFYDWVRLGAHLDSDFPLEDLRDVLMSVDRRRSDAGGGSSTLY